MIMADPTPVKATQPFQIPQIPSFEDPKEERLHRKQRLAAAFRLFSRFGFDEGVAGHITARDPERLDHFWVNPFGMSFSHIRVSDLILVNEKGEVVEGDYGVNTAAFVIHSQVHAARPDVIAAAWWFITMERSCQAQLLASAAGDPVLIEPDMAKLTARQVGSHAAGYVSFQPLYEK